MPEPSSENKPEEANLFSSEEANSLEDLPVSDVNFKENEDALIIKKSKKSEVENSLDDTEEVKIYRGKGSDNKNADATYGELIEELDSNGIRKESNDTEGLNLGVDIASSVDLPIGLVLEPLYQKDKSTFKVKTVGFIAVILFVLIIFLLWGGKNSTGHLLKPLVPIEEENTADTELRVRDTLKKFFGVTKKEELYGVIRKGDSASDRLADY